MKIYEYKTNRNTRYWTLLYIIAIAVLSLLMTRLYEGGYISAWFLSCVAAFIALTVMSVPRRIVVTEQRLLIRCVVDITEIPRSEIVSVRKAGRKDMRWMIPLFGSIGFFGYYGHFIDLKNMRRVEIYASEWDNFVEITTIYEDVYYVSCSRSDELVAELTAAEEAAPNGEADDASADKANDASDDSETV